MLASTAPMRLPTPRDIVIQTLVLGVIIVVVWGAVTSVRTNLEVLGLSSGFGFLERSTGWSYSFSFMERSIDDSYARTLTIGFVNTLVLGLICIVLSTVLGFLVGAGRDASNMAVNATATVFVQVFRNIPLILQLVFWYAVLIHMPGPRQAMSVMDMAFLSNRGMMVPSFNLPLPTGVLLTGFVVLAGFFIVRFVVARGAIKVLAWLGVSTIATILAFQLTLPADTPVVSVPELKGLRFVGGLTLSIELIAMIIGIVLYGAAYIAEVVRGGLQEVSKGLIEAAQSLGLRPLTVWMKVKMPMALRTIIPPLGNQWIFIMKATTIGVAIGFSDLFMIVSTSITQSGQTLELIGILMAAFLLINFTLAQMVNVLNARLKLKGH